MKSLEKDEKEKIKFHFAVALYKAYQNSGFKSYRQLANEVGIESSHIQKIGSGKLDVTLTTCISLARALGISYVSLASYVENVDQNDIDEYVKYSEEQKILRGKKEAKANTSKEKK